MSHADPSITDRIVGQLRRSTDSFLAQQRAAREAQARAERRYEKRTCRTCGDVPAPPLAATELLGPVSPKGKVQANEGYDSMTVLSKPRTTRLSDGTTGWYARRQGDCMAPTLATCLRPVARRPPPSPRGASRSSLSPNPQVVRFGGSSGAGSIIPHGGGEP